MSTEQVFEEVIELPDDVSASFEGRVLSIKGRLGSIKKDFERIYVDLIVNGKKIIIRPLIAKKKGYVITRTVYSLIKNMIDGVTKGYTYRLKVVYAHFPISVKVKEDKVIIENFMGERSPRIAKIVGDCKVSVEGEDVVVKGVSLEDVGQTAANIEQATKVKRKDQRVFLDGIYIYDKKEGI